MTAMLEARGLTKCYGRRLALSDCTVSIPPNRVVGLVGHNGAGKSTLLQLSTGLVAPSSGSIEVFGERPGGSPEQLARVGFVAQDAPVYAGLSVAEHLRLGARLNPRWDAGLAEARVHQLGLDPGQRAGRLSGGQRAQLALTVAAGKRPDLLILDEPVAALDPLARRVFLQNLMEFVAEQHTSVILSSHLITDLERVCDYLVLLSGSRLQLAGEVEDLIAGHYRLTGPRRDPADLPGTMEVIQAEHTDRQSTFIVRSDVPVPGLDWSVEHLELEDLVLTYMTRAVSGAGVASAVRESGVAR